MKETMKRALRTIYRGRALMAVERVLRVLEDFDCSSKRITGIDNIWKSTVRRPMKKRGFK